MIGFFQRYVLHNFGLKVVAGVGDGYVVHDFARRTAG